jgi:hypothetical protein
LSEAKAGGPDSGESIIAESLDACFNKFEARVLNEVAERLDVPGIKVVVRLLRVIRAIASFFFVGDKEK